jgi:autotransporter-associated beta strand protein
MTVILYDCSTPSNINGLTMPNPNGTRANSPNSLATGTVLHNLAMSGTLTNVTGRTVNTVALRAPTTTTTIGLSGPADQLVIGAGGFIINSNQVVTVQGGSLTAGTSTLYLNDYSSGTSTFNTPIVDNGNVALTLVRSGNATLTLSPLLVDFVGAMPNTTTINVANATGIEVGQVVSGTNIPAGATVKVIGTPAAAFTTSGTTATSSANITVPTTTGLVIGQQVSGPGIPANEYITAINGTTVTITTGTGVTAGSNSTLTFGAITPITISAAVTTATGATQVSFAPVQSTATGVTTANSNSVTIAAANLPANFVPAVGMTIGSTVNLAGGSTITAVDLSGGIYTLTLSQPATTTAANAALVFNAMSSGYTGDTVTQGGSLSTAGGTLNLSGAAGSLTVRGNLVINNSTVNMVANQGQIAATSSVSIFGGGVLNLVGTNTLDSLAFTNGGGTVNPTVNAGTMLILTDLSGISAVNDSTASTPTVAGTGVNFSNAAGTTITTSGGSPDSLVISAPITSAGTITKAGSGSLVLPNANTASLSWNLADGSLILNNATALGANTGSFLTISGNGTLLSGTVANLAVATPIKFGAGSSLTFGGTQSPNQLNLSGPIDLNDASPTISVPTPVLTHTISGVVSGGGGFTKGGPGALTLSGVNTFTGNVGVTGGLLTLSNLNAIPSANAIGVTVDLGAELNINAQAATLGSLAGGGIVTNSGGAVTLTVGTANADTEFFGLLTANTPANLALAKVGTGTQTLSTNVERYTGVTNVNAGTLNFGTGGGLTGALNVNPGGTLSSTSDVTVPLGNLVLNAGSAIAVTFSANTQPVIFSTATFSPAGLSRVDISGTPAPGTYQLIDYTGAAPTTAQFRNLFSGAVPTGFFSALKNNAGDTSVDLVVEEASDFNIYMGLGGGVLGTGHNFLVARAPGQQLVFNDAAVNTNISGVALMPQSLTFDNSTKNYVLSNDINGDLVGGIVKNGTGTVQLTGVNAGLGPVTINGGTLRAAVTSTGVNNAPASSLSGGLVTLNGGTLQFDGDSALTAATQGLFQRTFTSQATSVSSSINWGNNANSSGNVFTTGTATFPQGTGNTGTQFLGKLNITNGGQYAIFSSTDDGARVFIDGVLLVANEGGKGAVEQSGTISLTPGLHDVRVEYVNSGGSGSETLSIQGPGVAKQVIPASMLFQPETSSAGATTLTQLALGNAVAVTSDSTINLAGANNTGVLISSLTSAPGTTLNVTGDAGKQLRVGNTFVSGVVTYNTVADLALGGVSDLGVAATIVKQGSGRMVLDNTATAALSGSSLVAGSTFDIRAGKLSLLGQSGGANPAGAAKLQLNGGGLILDTKFGTATFDSAVAVVQSGLLEVLPTGQTVVLGSAANGVTLGDGTTLTVQGSPGSRATGIIGNVQALGAVLQVNGVISGNGNLVLQSNQSMNIEQYPAYGALTLTAVNTFQGSTTVNGSYTNFAIPLTLTLNGNGTLANTSGIALNNALLAIDSSTAQPNRVNDAADLTLNSGLITYKGSTTVNSTEKVGALAGNSGFNQVVMTQVFATGTTSLTADALVRNNHSQFAFAGTTLGGAATNADHLKFATAPALSGGIIPYAVSANLATPIQWGLTTYDANGVRPLATGEYTTLAAASATDNARDVITGSAAAITGANVNAYVIDNTTTAATVLTLTGTLAPASGALVFAATSATAGAITLNGPTATDLIDFGTAEGVITVADTAGATIGAKIAGSGGLTVGGFGSLTLGNNANSFEGPVTINFANSISSTVGAIGALTAPALSISGDGALGATSNELVFGGGTLRFPSTATTLAATRAVTLTPAGGTFDTGAANVAYVVAGPVSGAGGLNKIGSNTLTLSNAANDYSGLTNVFGGTLVTNSGPQGNIALNLNTTVQFDQAIDGTYSGAITGIGNLIKSKAGVLTLSGDSTFVGTTTINAAGGTILLTGTMNGATVTTNAGTTFQMGDGTAGHDGNVLGTAVITNNGALVFNRSGTVTTNAAIGGSGNMQVTGTGRQILTGVNTFGGNIAIDAGATLQLGDGATDGSFTSPSGFANEGTLVFAPAGAISNSGSISGNGAVVMNGPGSVLFNVGNSYTGGTTINGGTLQVNSITTLGDLSGAVAINAGTLQATNTFATMRTFTLGSASSAVAVDAAQTLTLDGSLSGPGKLNKTGAGRLVLNSGASTAYTGGTDVVAGVLELHAGVSGNVAIGTDATLDATGLPAGELNLNATQVIETTGSGTGTVLGSLTTAGTVSPGGDLNTGTLAASGGTKLSDGASLKIDIAGPGANDLLHTPTVTLGNNVTLNLSVLGDYVHTLGTLYVIADTGSVTTGVFANTSLSNFGSLMDPYTTTPNETFTTVEANNGLLFAVSYTGSATEFEAAGGTNLVLMAVPEPSMAGTLLAGLGVLAGLQRFRSRTRKSAVRG